MTQEHENSIIDNPAQVPQIKKYELPFMTEKPTLNSVIEHLRNGEMIIFPDDFSGSYKRKLKDILEECLEKLKHGKRDQTSEELLQALDSSPRLSKHFHRLILVSLSHISNYIVRKAMVDERSNLYSEVHGSDKQFVVGNNRYHFIKVDQGLIPQVLSADTLSEPELLILDEVADLLLDFKLFDTEIDDIIPGLYERLLENPDLINFAVSAGDRHDTEVSAIQERLKSKNDS